jgi:hypothetical protein
MKLPKGYEKYASLPDCDGDALKPGRFGLSGGNHFIQRCIRFFTGSPFSHSFVVFDGPTGADTLETSATIVQVAPVSRKLEEPDWILLFEPLAGAVERQDAAVDCYAKHSARWYGYLSYLWFMWRWAARWLGMEPSTMWKWAAGGVTCTELTTTWLGSLFRVGPLLQGQDLNCWSPEELGRLCLQKPAHLRPVGWLRRPGVSGR